MSPRLAVAAVIRKSIRILRRLWKALTGRVAATRSPLRVSVTDSSGPLDFSDPGTKVTFYSWNISDGSAAIKAATIDKGHGFVEYRFTPKDTNTVGEYKCRFRVVWPGGRVSFVPREGFIVYRVQDKNHA